jgi:hypothetical protein
MGARMGWHGMQLEHFLTHMGGADPTEDNRFLCLEQFRLVSAPAASSIVEPPPPFPATCSRPSPCLLCQMYRLKLRAYSSDPRIDPIIRSHAIDRPIIYLHMRYLNTCSIQSTCDRSINYSLAHALYEHNDRSNPMRSIDPLLTCTCVT